MICPGPDILVVCRLSVVEFGSVIIVSRDYLMLLYAVDVIADTLLDLR